MTNFIGIKIHYDHRPSLPIHLKYSKAPTAKEYNEYKILHRSEGIGGDGFHECLNFSISDHDKVKIYLPPGYTPSQGRISEDFVIFSFTYKSDREMPSHIIGVHAGVTILEKQKVREDTSKIEGIDDQLSYHAEAPQNLTTIFSTPIIYDFYDGNYTPKYKKWGNGLRILDESHASNIINEALRTAKEEIIGANVSKREVLDRQINVLNEIKSLYFSEDSGIIHETNSLRESTLPDQELGYIGERLVYLREVEHAEKIGASASDVEWISQSVPQSPFDIKTVRKINGKIIDNFIEVKSSRAKDDSNIYVSSRQIEFFNNHEDQCSFSFVSFDRNDSHKIRDISLSELLDEFDLSPIKFKLQKRNKE